jgi:UDP-N-acetyl-D-glucosamine dehydrogenase
MPYHVVDLVAAGLSRRGKVLRGARVLILGVAFKKDVDDARNSPSERIIELLLERGAEVSYNDPYVPQYRIERSVFYHENRVLTSQPLTEELLRGADCVVVVAGHSAYDYSWIARHSSLLVDSVNATAGVEVENADIVRLGTPGAAQGKSVQHKGEKR